MHLEAMAITLGCGSCLGIGPVYLGAARLVLFGFEMDFAFMTIVISVS